MGGNQHEKHKEKNKKNDEGNKINLTPSKAMFCRYREFMKMPQYSLDKVRIYLLTKTFLAFNKKCFSLCW
jgi:hypothetical protein